MTLIAGYSHSLSEQPTVAVVWGIHITRNSPTLRIHMTPVPYASRLHLVTDVSISQTHGPHGQHVVPSEGSGGPGPNAAWSHLLRTVFIAHHAVLT